MTDDHVGNTHDQGAKANSPQTLMILVNLNLGAETFREYYSSFSK
jgi:hypothetical protein